ncbi:MAG: endopeptidase La [Chloroflexi bacterium]|nr:endopeptidase La [Chloroflexota bacterium]MCL5075037.1 endopeptidase La [Chloroflexota bacterium]
MARKRSKNDENELLMIAELPVLPIRDTVLFPRMITPLVVGRERSVRAIEDAMLKERTIVVVAQRQPELYDITFDDVYTVGTEATIGRMLKMPDGTISVLVQGQRRVKLLSFTQSDPYIKSRVSPLSEYAEKTISVEALMRAVLALFEKCVKLSGHLSDETYVAAMNIDEPGWLADLVASSLSLSVQQRQEILETLNPVERLQKANVLLAKELDVLELESRIQSQVQQEVDKSHREYVLREQLKAIQRELGEVDAQAREINELREKIKGVGMPDNVARKAEDELTRLSTMPAAAPEVAVIRTYLDWLVNLPWSNETADNLDIKQAAKVLEENHYGLMKVKERILEYMAVRRLAGERMRSPILCFVGPPGVGKTSLGRSIAQSLGRKFVRISLGGIRDEAEIRGHRRTYVGALPGRIIQTMRTAGTINPVFMMDEIDKVGIDFRGDPSAALLEVLDPEQNYAFSDHYLDVPYNLSKVMFITTANILDPVPPALRDRMEVIELPGYIEEEKLQIAKRFLVPKQLSQHGLNVGQLHFSEGALRQMIREYTHEAGLRNLEREIGSICRKVAKVIAEGEKAPTTIVTQSLPKYLGPPRFFWGVAEERDEVGVATGVYWTEAGGDLATIEVTLMDGKGSLILTGQLGEIMKESATAAMSYTRSKAKDLHIWDGFYEKMDIHIHLPAGAIPKDGPSAGIAMATALISALTRRPVRREVAMTGEITLRGRVLPVGGLKEKVLAAHRAGITTFILPKRNQKDMVEIPADVKRQLNFVFVEKMEEVLQVALQKEAMPPKIVEERRSVV